MAKIVHVTSVHNPLDTRIFYKECMTLKKAGYEVVLIAPHDSDDYVNGIIIRAVPKPKNRIQRMLITSYQVLIKAIEEKAQIYHIHDPELLPGVQILRILGYTVIYDMHENVPKDISTKSWIRPEFRILLSKIYRFFERILLWKMPVIFAESSYQKDYKWLKHYANVLNMPLHTELLSIKEDKYQIPTIGYIGSVAPERGSILTLQSLQMLKNKNRSVHWECIGPPMSNNHKDQLVYLTSKYGLDGINFRGFMLPDVGLSIIAKCHIGLAILKPIPNFIESYPTKIFEYMALGLPVITSNFPLYRNIIEKERCGICIDPESREELANAIEWLLDHPYDAQLMGKRGRDAVTKRYNWDNEGQKLLIFYKELLS